MKGEDNDLLQQLLPGVPYRFVPRLRQYLLKILGGPKSVRIGQIVVPLFHLQRVGHVFGLELRAISLV